MAKIINFDNSIDYKLDKANEAYDEQLYDEALPLLFSALKQDENNIEAKMLIARIYAEMGQPDYSSEMYYSVLADDDNTSAVKGIISNLMLQGYFRDARYYSDLYKTDYDFSDFLSVEDEDGEILYDGDEDDEDAERGVMHIVLSKKTLDGENLIGKKKTEDMTVEDIKNCPLGDELFSLKDLMEKLLAAENTESLEEIADDTHRRTEIGFKQVYPVTADDCEKIIADSYNLNNAGKPAEALELLNKIDTKCGKYYYLSQKSKVLCYLALNRYSSMKNAAEEAQKIFPEDYTLTCYRYIALKLLEENIEADKLLKEIIGRKASGTAECLVKLDVCRFAMYHKGIIECTDCLMEELPYQPQLLLLRGKAKFNNGQKKSARADFLEIIKLYPDNYEAKQLIEKIDSKNEDLLAYGDMDMSILRVKMCAQMSALEKDSAAFINYLKYDKDAVSDIEYLLLNESDRNIYGLISGLCGFMSASVEDMYKRLLLKISASQYLKMAILTFYFNAAAPKKVAVTVGRCLKIIEMPSYGWEKGLSDVVILAADMTMAEFIVKHKDCKKLILSLTSRLKMISEYLKSPTDRSAADFFMNTTDGVAVRRALSDITLNKARTPYNADAADENYMKVIKLFKIIEDEYEI